MSFGERLQTLRKTKGMSQEQLAERLEISRQAVSKWEMNTSMPDADNLIELSNLFEVTIDYLLKNQSKQEENPVAPEVPTVPQRQNPVYWILGSIFLGLGTIGALIIGILSSVFPAIITYPVEAAAPSGSSITEVILTPEIFKTGLPAFLELHNIAWLFWLCILSMVAGIILFCYPKIKQLVLKHTKSE